MTQEIITYIIIGIAIVMVVSKMRQKFKSLKIKGKRSIYKETTSNQHKCSDCVAECVLRDATVPATKNNRDLCKKIETASD